MEGTTRTQYYEIHCTWLLNVKECSMTSTFNQQMLGRRCGAIIDWHFEHYNSSKGFNSIARVLIRTLWHSIDCTLFFVFPYILNIWTSFWLTDVIYAQVSCFRINERVENHILVRKLASENMKTTDNKKCIARSHNYLSI